MTGASGTGPRLHGRREHDGRRGRDVDHLLAPAHRGHRDWRGHHDVQIDHRGGGGNDTETASIENPAAARSTSSSGPAGPRCRPLPWSARRLHRDLPVRRGRLATCCHTRPQRRPFDPDGAMAQALRVPACAAGAAGNPRRPLVGAGAGQAARLDDALGAATMAEQNTVMVGEWHGNGLDIEHQRAPARSASSSRPAGAGVDHLHAGQGHRDPPGQRGRRDEGELVALLQALLTIELGKPHRSAHSPNGGLSTSWHHGAKPPILARRAACAAGTAGNPVLATCRCRSPSSRGRVSAPVRVVDLVHLPPPQPLKSVRASPP
jgi:hypothetical protein